MAWLNATPKPVEVTGQPPVKTPSLSRFQQMGGEKATLPMPPNPAPHIIGWLTEIGLVDGGGMGMAPLRWSEIAAWQAVSGVTLEPWAARLIRRLSVEYVAMSRKAENENCPSPWRAPVSDWERDTETERLMMVLG